VSLAATLRGILDRRSTDPQVDALVRALPNGAVAIDCGANVGTVTRALARRCRLVVAFEPSPVAFAVLERRLGGCPNVELVEAAVGVESGRRRLFQHEDWRTAPLAASGGASFYPSKLNVVADRWTDVDVVDLDAFVAELGLPVDLLKLDVEGAEIEILERLLETGRIGVFRSVVVELHDDKIPELAERGAAVRAALADPRYAHVRLDWR
jgi:FkbM family methyltransferase